MTIKEIRWRKEPRGELYTNISVFQGKRRLFLKKYVRFHVVLGSENTIENTYRIICKKDDNTYYPTSFIFPEAHKALRKLPLNPFSHKKIKRYLTSIFPTSSSSAHADF